MQLLAVQEDLALGSKARAGVDDICG